ncbi:MAG: glutamate acetyltransferase [Stigonema ocellatum SAG 48.90 = DSM 106950]|nr:glutamate acetyltransferase [Stigonema ocellatum SAG 48.90 = DSM 106950]
MYLKIDARTSVYLLKRLWIKTYVYEELLPSKYIAIKQLVYSYLEKSLSIYTDSTKMICIREGNIPLYKGRDNNRILYISGIALQISKYENFSAMEIANGIVSHLPATCSEDFHVQIVSPGWIHLELTHPTLATWLQSIVEWGVGNGEWGIGNREWGIGNREWGVGNGEKGEKDASLSSLSPLSPLSPLSSPTPHSLFPTPHSPSFSAQYAHARCCSLLRLGHQQGLIQLRHLDTVHGGVPSSKPIPWLDCDAKLRLSHPASGRLIAELVKVVDQLEYSYNWEKAALDLSQAFETFWRNCRIFGEMKTTSPELAQARLGLIMATQSVLRFLLEEKLGISALLEL